MPNITWRDNVNRPRSVNAHRFDTDTFIVEGIIDKRQLGSVSIPIEYAEALIAQIRLASAPEQLELIERI